MSKITAEKVANFVFDNAEIMNRQKAMDAFEKRLGMVNGMELKKKQIELNSAKLEKMDADIFKTRAQAQSTIEKVKQKMQPQPQPVPVMPEQPAPIMPGQSIPKMAAPMPGQANGGMKPAAMGGGTQAPKPTSFSDAASAGNSTRQAPKLPEAAPPQSAGAAPTNFVPQPAPPPEIVQPTGIPKSPVPMNLTATPSAPGSLPKFASVSSLSSPNASKTAFRGNNISETIKLFPQINQHFKKITNN